MLCYHSESWLLCYLICFCWKVLENFGFILCTIYIICCSPSTAANQVIYTVAAFDDDVIEPFNQVTFSLDDSFSNSGGFFTINQRGEIRVRGNPTFGADNVSTSSMYITLHKLFLAKYQ